jgi:hypothetical protein
MTRFIIAAVVGGVIVMAWGAVSWMVLPFHSMSLHSVPAEEAEVNELLSRVPEHGVYHYPGFPHHEDGTPVTAEEMQEMFERMRRGPVISLMIVHPHGKDPFPGQNFIIGTATNIIGAGILAAIVGRFRRDGASWISAMGIVLAFAVFAVCAAVVPSWLWWGYPWLYGTLEVTDVIIAWLLAGAVVCAIMPARQP